jgi:hypothetical protein
MFDQVVVRPRRRALGSVLVIGSAMVHAAALATVAVAAMWQVDKVSLGPDRGEVAIAAPRPPAGAAQLPSGSKLPDPLKPPTVRSKDVVQPPAGPSAPPAATGGGPGGPLGPATDGPPGPPDAPPCTDPAGCVTDDGPGTPPEPPVVTTTKDDVPPPPPVVPSTVARGLRLSGDEQIFPSRPTQLAMVHDGKTTVRATFQLCVDEDGSIASVRRLAGTGYDEYDEALAAAMRGWRYRPYMMVRADRPGDPPVPTKMCTVQVFVYRIR